MPESTLLSLILLLGGILPLVAGPFLAQWAENSRRTKAAFDAFIAVALGGIVILHLWPHAFLVAGLWALAGGLGGMLLPFLLHGSLHSQERKIYPAMIAVVVLGLAVHAILDGVALLSPLVVENSGGAVEEVAGTHDHDHFDHSEIEAGEAEAAHEGHEEDILDPHHHHQESATLLALAVILHRLPMGLAVWWLTVPVLGRRVAIALLGAMVAATVVGFGLAGQVLVDLTLPGIAVFEATIAGMLLHVVMGHEHSHGAHDHQHGAHDHGAHDHDHGAHDHGAHEISHDRGGPPDGPIDDPSFSEVDPRYSALGTVFGALLVAALGEVHPMEQRFAQELSFGDAFMTLALQLAPWLLVGIFAEAVLAWKGQRLPVEVSLPAALVAWSLLGWHWTLAYAVGVVWVTWLVQRSKDGGTKPGNSVRRVRWRSFLERGLHRRGLWALIGIGTVSLLEPILRIDPKALETTPNWLGAALVLGLALFLGFFCGRDPLFALLIAFFFLHMEWTPAPVLLFLLAGLVGRVLRRERPDGKVAAWLWLGVGLQVLTLAGLSVSGVADFHGIAEGTAAWWQWIALTVVVASLVLALFSKGFRAFLRPIFGVAREFHGESLEPAASGSLVENPG